MYVILCQNQATHLDTDASGVGLRAGLLQMGSGRNFPRDKAPNNSILRPIAFVSKSLSSAEKDTAT